ncbi:MAG: hypothetical protein KBD63_01070 [Bacteriovoracaceae bacterium]|nr:hypothetical protein [Bacteriovoracaceae bacterium]
MKWQEQLKNGQNELSSILSFDEYMTILKEHPERELRNNALYVKDMFNYFGQNEKGGFKLFNRTKPHSPQLQGQWEVQKAIYEQITHFTEEGFNNKFLLLIGPNGSAKTTLIRKIMEGLEDYSKLEEGALHTFSWIFPIDTFVKGGLGLSQNITTDKTLMSYANLDDKYISAILSADLKESPLLLIPLMERQSLIHEFLEKKPKLLEMVKKTSLYHGDLSKRNRMIFDALLKNYKGDYLEVFKHIRVERLSFSKNNSLGLITIEPQLHVDAHLQQITMDRRMANLPPSLQSLNLFNLSGEAVMANRGVLEFSDLLKRPLDTFKYLLMTMETRTINLQGILTELDILFVGSSNETHYAAFKQHPDFNSFKGRFHFVKVPYLLSATLEEKIYEEQKNNLKQTTIFEPHALEILCLWSVMTRLRPCARKNFESSQIGEIAETLNPLEKALLYAEEIIPARFNSEQKKILKTHIPLILNEYLNDTFYEGKFGISPREVKQIIYEISLRYPSLSFIEVLEYLETFNDRKNEFDFLNIAEQGDYHSSLKFIALLKKHALSQLDSEVRTCLGLVDDRSYEEYLGRYIVQISHLMRGEKVKSAITGKSETADTYFIKEFENNIGLTEEPKVFHSHLIATLGAYSLDHPKKTISYTDVFPEIVKKLQESFHNEQKKIIGEVADNLVFFLSDFEKLPPEKRVFGNEILNQERYEKVNTILRNLISEYHYSEVGALNLLKYLIKECY